MTKRLYYDNSIYYKEKAKLPKPDGKHCIICGGNLPKGKRKYCSKKCFNNWYVGLAIRDWNLVRSRVLKRDNYTCQDCNLYDPDRYKIEVHHIIPIKDGGDEFDEDNCVTLCKECHLKRHRLLNKKCKSLKDYEKN